MIAGDAKYQEQELALYDALLSQKGLQHLMDVASEILGNPLFFADMSAITICESKSCTLDGQKIPCLSDAESEAYNMKEAASAGYFDWIYKHDEPIIGQYGEGQPRYLAARVRDGASIIGHITVAERDRPFEESDNILLPVICKTVAFEMRHRMESDSRMLDYGALLKGLISGREYDEGWAESQFALLNYRFPRSFRLLVFRPDVAGHATSPTYLRSQLLSVFPDSIGVVFGEECVHLIDGDTAYASIASRIERDIYTGGVVIGASRVASRVTDVHEAYLQADAAIRLSADMPEGAVRSFDDVVGRYLLERATSDQVCTARMFVMPEIVKLMELDKQDDADRIGDLSAFLNCGRSVPRAADYLHVHRNSMYYRLKKIRELIDVDLEDEKTCFLLQLSLALIGRGPGLPLLD